MLQTKTIDYQFEFSNSLTIRKKLNKTERDIGNKRFYSEVIFDIHRPFIRYDLQVHNNHKSVQITLTNIKKKLSNYHI